MYFSIWLHHPPHEPRTCQTDFNTHEQPRGIFFRNSKPSRPSTPILPECWKKYWATTVPKHSSYTSMKNYSSSLICHLHDECKSSGFIFQAGQHSQKHTARTSIPRGITPRGMPLRSLIHSVKATKSFYLCHFLWEHIPSSQHIHSEKCVSVPPSSVLPAICSHCVWKEQDMNERRQWCSVDAIKES